MDGHVFTIAGMLVPITFWLTLALCGSKHNNYSHLSNMVSELGATGTKTKKQFAIGLILSSVFSLIFIIGLIQECRVLQLNTIPVFLILTFTVSIAGAAIYPLPHRLHGILGSPSMGLFLSPGLACILWRQEPSLRGLLPISILSLLTMLLGILVLFPHVLSKYTGLKQRFFHIGWSIWFVYLSIAFV